MINTNDCTLCGHLYCTCFTATSGDWNIGVPGSSSVSAANYGNDAILERLDRMIELLEGMDADCCCEDGCKDDDEGSLMHDLRGSVLEDEWESDCLNCDCPKCYTR